MTEREHEQHERDNAGRKRRRTAEDDEHRPPLPGPHAKESLTDPDATPGTGALPDPYAPEIDPGAG